MIVRDEERNLPNCLESVRGLFDEIVVVDTGSTDRTKEIAASFGARVVDFTWTDDFAAARNVALDQATGDYTLWLYADEVIEPSHRKNLETLLAQLQPTDMDTYVLRCVCDTSEGEHLVIDQPRLFPLRPEIRWVYRVHEQFIPALSHAKCPIRWTNIILRHSGYADPVIHDQQQNLVVPNRELAERQNDPYAYYYLPRWHSSGSGRRLWIIADSIS